MERRVEHPDWPDPESSGLSFGTASVVRASAEARLLIEDFVRWSIEACFEAS